MQSPQFPGDHVTAEQVKTILSTLSDPLSGTGSFILGDIKFMVVGNPEENEVRGKWDSPRTRGRWEQGEGREVPLGILKKHAWGSTPGLFTRPQGRSPRPFRHKKGPSVGKLGPMLCSAAG